MRSIRSHVEGRETRNLFVEHRIFIVIQLFLLRIVRVTSTARANIMHTIFIKMLERVVITGERDDMFAFCRIFLKERTHLTRFVCPLTVIAGGMNTYVMADENPRTVTDIENGVSPLILLATRQEIRRRRITVDIQNDHIRITINEMEIGLTSRVFDGIL